MQKLSTKLLWKNSKNWEKIACMATDKTTLIDIIQKERKFLFFSSLLELGAIASKMGPECMESREGGAVARTFSPVDIVDIGFHFFIFKNLNIVL